MRSRNNTGLWVLLLLLAGGGFYLWHQHSAKPVPITTEPVMTVSVVTPQQTTLSDMIHVSGQVVAKDDLAVSAGLSGVRITRLLAEEGQWVKKGQPLAELDVASARNQFTQLDAQYKQAALNFERVDRIKKSGAVTMSEVEEKRTAYASAKAARDDAALKVELGTVSAPAPGLVFERTANVGTLVGGSEPLFHIARDGQLELEALVSEADAPSLKVGETATILLPSGSISGKIRLVSPRVDNNSRSVKLRISLAHGAPVSIGSYVEAQLAAKPSNGLVLPQTAVNLSSEGAIIWTVGPDGSVGPLPVTVTMRAGDRVMVEAPALSPDMQVVAKAGPFLHTGDHVAIAPEPAK